MSIPITPVRGISLPESIGPSRGPAQAPNRTGADFGAALDKAMTQVEQSRQSADAKVERFLGGKPEELHSVVLASQRAQLEFELLLEVRNKVVQAYQEIMRMQV